MTTEKRKVSKLMLFNCLTLGIYGAVQHQRLGNEINELCQGDGEQPRFGYIGSVLFQLIPYGILLLAAIISASTAVINPSAWVTELMWASDIEDILWSVGSILSSVFLRSALLQPLYALASISFLLSWVYRQYWWYKQAGRLKLNAWRYDITVRESGVDTIMFRTLAEIPLLAVTVVSVVLHLLVPAIVCLLVSIISAGFAVALMIIFVIIFVIFEPDCTAGAYLATYFVYKNMNRLGEAGTSGKPFNPMGYEYYPSVQNCYTNFVPRAVYGEWNNGGSGEGGGAAETPVVDTPKKAFLEGTHGTNKGYSFELIPGEEVVIGRNPSEANVVIDNSYEQVSGRHVGVTYEQEFDTFRVMDYSLNGTYVDGTKLENGKEYTFHRGSRIELVDGKNSFRLK
jgi:hypothetical protein